MTSPNLVWNTVYGLKPHKQLSFALFDLAAECARRAVEEPERDASGLDGLVRLISIGQAAELLVKSTLAAISPTLLAGQANTATLHALTGSTRRLPGKVTTIGAVESLRRLNDCRPPTVQPAAEPKHMFEVRNDAVHLGLAPTGVGLDEALTELVILVRSVFNIREELGFGHDWSAFWSAKHLKIVRARERATYERLLKNFKQLIKEAKSGYARLTAGLGPDERNRLIEELITRTPEIDDDQTLRPHKCPACKNSLWVVYDVRRDIELDDSDAPHSVGFMARVHGDVWSATCPVCGLSLDQANIVLTDIPFTIELGDDMATDDEEEGWYAAHDAKRKADFWDVWDGDT